MFSLAPAIGISEALPSVKKPCNFQVTTWRLPALDARLFLCSVLTALATARTMLTTQDSKRSFILSETPVEQMAQSCSAPVPAEGKARGARTHAGLTAAAGPGLLQLGFEHLLWWRLCDLSGQPIPALAHPHRGLSLLFPSLPCSLQPYPSRFLSCRAVG